MSNGPSNEGPRKPNGKRAQRRKRLRATLVGVVGGGVIAGGIWLNSGRKEASKKGAAPAREVKKEKASPLTSITIGGDRYWVIASRRDAVDGIKFGKFAKEVEQIRELGDDSFTYVLKGSDGMVQYVLSGVKAGEANESFLMQMEKAGAVVLGKASATVAQPDAKPIAQIPIQPWYSPFIWPAALVASVWIVVRAIQSKVGSMQSGSDGSSQGAAIGRQEFSKLAEEPDASFDDVGGNQSAVAELKGLVGDIKSYQKGNSGVVLPKGVLYVGGPGVGKTLMARVLAGEAGCPIIVVSLGDLLRSPYIGSRSKSISDLYEAAREIRDRETKALKTRYGHKARQVVVVFIDEFDAVGASRSGAGNHREDDKGVNTLLAEMDNVVEGRNDGIILIAATNNEDALDPALTRPGRFTRRFHIIGPATAEERLDILIKNSCKILTKRDMDFASGDILPEIARITQGLSGDHLRGIIEEAATIAARDNREEIAREDVYEAYQRTRFGHAHRGFVQRSRRELVAAHEFGHALVMVACGIDPLVVSMVPRGSSLGRVVGDADLLTEPPMTRDDLLRLLVCDAAGRAGELFYAGLSGATNGVGSDYAHIGGLLRSFIDSGMLDGGYTVNHGNANEHDLPPEYRALMREFGDRAVYAGLKILEVVGSESFAKMRMTSIDREVEYVGPAAKEFIMSHLTANHIVQMKELIDEFIAQSSALALDIPAGYQGIISPSNAGSVRSFLEMSQSGNGDGAA